jgi:2-polyprenyl-3-methyl-5-hydroxy-6-metoxy-1,4-benzoquinol methylase
MLATEKFDEGAYLAANKDVRKAVAAGVFESGQHHYETYGRGEGRPLREDVVTDIAGLDAKIEWLRDLEARSYDEWLPARAKFRFHEDTDNLPINPFSREYSDRQIQLYKHISGIDTYNPWTSEPIAISLEHSADPFPFPFSTQNGDLIAGHLLSLSRIIQTIWRASPGGGKRVLEYGCGTGFTTLFLATSGYKMTAVDINADALAVVDRMAKNRGLSIDTLNGVFGDLPEDGLRYDVVLFYEAFHHALDFMSLLRRLHDCILPGGIVVFSGEPVFDDFPKPWGLRLDGGALWEIRTKGWLEIGFHLDFFVAALDMAGWSCERLQFTDTPDIFVAREKAAANVA